MSKQTAVDVYHRHIRHLIAMGLKLSEPDKTFLNSAYRDCKAMEREQMIDAYSNGWHDGQDVILQQSKHIDKGGDDAGQKYYNETYKGGEQ
jgi:hypothetical protein